MTVTRLAGLFRLFRFELPFTAGVCVVLGQIIVLGAFPSPGLWGPGFLTFFMISASALILNDCFDIETDRINAPGRPLPSGLVTRTEALILGGAVALLGFLSAMLLGVDALLVAVAVWCIGFLYNWRLKKSGLTGNVLVALSVGMTFVFGGMVAGSPFHPLVWYFAVTTLLIDLAEEIAADALDVKGDLRTGSRSLAVRHGPGPALRISAGVFGLVVAGTTLPFLFGWLSLPYLPVMAALDVIIIVSVRNLLNPGRTERLRDIQRIYRAGLAMILLTAAIRLLVG